MSEETETLQELLTEAHGVIQELRQLNREARRLIDAMPTVVADTVGAQILEAVNSETAAYHDAMSKAIADASTSIYARFDELGKMLLGETTKANRLLDEQTTMEEQILRVRKVIEDRGFK